MPAQAQEAAKEQAEGAWWDRMLKSVDAASRPVEPLATGQNPG
jgi:hypothetical protein